MGLVTKRRLKLLSLCPLRKEVNAILAKYGKYKVPPMPRSRLERLKQWLEAENEVLIKVTLASGFLKNKPRPNLYVDSVPTPKWNILK